MEQVSPSGGERRRGGLIGIQLGQRLACDQELVEQRRRQGPHERLRLRAGRQLAAVNGAVHDGGGRRQARGPVLVHQPPDLRRPRRAGQQGARQGSSARIGQDFAHRPRQPPEVRCDAAGVRYLDAGLGRARQGVRDQLLLGVPAPVQRGLVHAGPGGDGLEADVVIVAAR